MLRHGAFASDSGSHNQAIVGNHRLKEEHLNIYQILLYACGGWRTIPLVTCYPYLLFSDVVQPIHCYRYVHCSCARFELYYQLARVYLRPATPACRGTRSKCCNAWNRLTVMAIFTQQQLPTTPNSQYHRRTTYSYYYYELQ